MTTMEAEYVNIASPRFLSQDQVTEALRSMKKKSRTQIGQYCRLCNKIGSSFGRIILVAGDHIAMLTPFSQLFYVQMRSGAKPWDLKL